MYIYTIHISYKIVDLSQKCEIYTIFDSPILYLFSFRAALLYKKLHVKVPNKFKVVYVLSSMLPSFLLRISDQF